jgi:hypothetical protein
VKALRFLGVGLAAIGIASFIGLLFGLAIRGH